MYYTKRQHEVKAFIYNSKTKEIPDWFKEAIKNRKFGFIDVGSGNEVLVKFTNNTAQHIFMGSYIVLDEFGDYQVYSKDKFYLLYKPSEIISSADFVNHVIQLIDNHELLSHNIGERLFSEFMVGIVENLTDTLIVCVKLNDRLFYYGRTKTNDGYEYYRTAQEVSSYNPEISNIDGLYLTEYEPKGEQDNE